MKVDDAALALSSRRIAVEQHRRSESLTAWIGSRRPDFEAQRPNRAAGAPARSDSVVLSARARQATSGQAARPAADDGTRSDDDLHPEMDPKTRLLLLLVERLIGRRIEILSWRDWQQASQAPAEIQPIAGEATPPPPPAPPRPGYGLEYDVHESYSEAEQTTFTAAGVVKTADGQQIDVDLALTMSREFARELSQSVRAGDAVPKDPLVVNFGGAGVQLSGARFTFDLDGDGQTESLPALQPNSGFLAIDRDADGRIDDGRELFGARTGDGFAELAAYDQDGNAWIDERDPVYDQLKVWTRPGQPGTALATLKQAGVGAISLRSTTTPFALKDQQNQVHGQIGKTGIYLTEAGSAGTIQKLDLFV